MSAETKPTMLDDALDALDALLVSDKGVEDMKAARTELAALRSKLADAELMLLAAFPDDDPEHPFMAYGEGCTGEPTFYVHRDADDLDPIILDADERGLPIMTEPARSALQSSPRPEAP